MLFLFGLFGKRCLGQQQNAGDRNRVFERDAHHLCRIDNPGLDQIHVLAAGGIETEFPLPDRMRSTTTPPSTVEFSAIWRVGASRARRKIRSPVRSSPEQFASSH